MIEYPTVGTCSPNEGFPREYNGKKNEAGRGKWVFLYQGSGKVHLLGLELVGPRRTGIPPSVDVSFSVEIAV